MSFGVERGLRRSLRRQLWVGILLCGRRVNENSQGDRHERQHGKHQNTTECKNTRIPLHPFGFSLPGISCADETRGWQAQGFAKEREVVRKTDNLTSLPEARYAEWAQQTDMAATVNCGAGSVTVGIVVSERELRLIANAHVRAEAGDSNIPEKSVNGEKVQVVQKKGTGRSGVDTTFLVFYGQVCGRKSSMAAQGLRYVAGR